ncbi:LytR/AlgR family response regulator transcription factor [Paenibacillus lemnae]|uniref:Response regulator transcription factor n=1 Tax=Paenibacillus lemnae TaxID=1330551 RepID=A0A848M393_PAELE|nr:LytTR family DNA-binding domain-containing protein [Paenibacillus lemnae]NMO95046.1 response regulator transcription factor [Paenibacillus lemnae]
MIRVIIADEQKNDMERIKFYIDNSPGFHIVDTCINEEELIDSVIKNQPHLILLETRLPGMNGIEAMRSCMNIQRDLLCIFITSYDEYAVEAFELAAVDYILKPVEKKRIYRALEKAGKRFESQQESFLLQRLTIKDGQNSYYIRFDHILFIEKIGKKCHILTKDKMYHTTDTIENLLGQLPGRQFFLSHRSYIVNLNWISGISSESQTYLAYFHHTTKYAHVSKLKIVELQQRMQYI